MRPVKIIDTGLQYRNETVLRLLMRHAYTFRVQLSNRLYPRLFLPFAATLVLAILLAWWGAVQLLTNTLEQRLESQLQHTTEVLVQGNLPLTPELLGRVENLLRARILIRRPDGSFAPHAAFPAMEEVKEALRRHSVITREKSTASSLRIQADGAPHLAVIRPSSAGKATGADSIIAVTSLADVRTTTRHTAWWLGAAALIGILSLAWLGHRVARSITSPLEQLVDLSERIAAGDRTTRVHLDQRDEIGVLSEALNRMAEHLQIYEQEATEQNRLVTLGEMAARVAHEIRNPLTAIRLQLQLLGESLGNGDRERVTRLLAELDRLELIVSSTLTMARPQQLKPRPTDLQELVREVCDLVSPQLAHRHIVLDEEAEPLPLLPLDGDRFKQVIFNLFANAADALSDGGTIRIRTEADEQEVRLTVEDSGPGIGAEQRERLFCGAAGGKANSLGVGLLLCRELVELHGGRIEVDSSPELGGARFRVRLPVAGMPE